jgi:hypothetical protein
MRITNTEADASANNRAVIEFMAVAYRNTTPGYSHNGTFTTTTSSYYRVGSSIYQKTFNIQTHALTVSNGTRTQQESAFFTTGSGTQTVTFNYPTNDGKANDVYLLIYIEDYTIPKGHPYYLQRAVFYGTFTLPAIERKSSISLSPSGTITAGDTLTINVSPVTSGATHRYTYRIGTGTETQIGSGLTGGTTWAIPANLVTTATTYTISCYTTVSGAVSTAYTQNITVNPRPGGTFTISPTGSLYTGNTATFTITAGATGATAYVLKYKIGTAPEVQIYSGTELAYAWEIPVALVTSTQTVTFNLYTTYGSYTAPVSTTTRTVYSAAEFAPVFPSTSVTYADTNTAITAVTGNDQWIVQNKSTLTVTITEATAQQGATISQYVVNVNGTIYTYTAAGVKNLGTYPGNSTFNLNVTAVDSKGIQTTVTKSVTVQAYTAPYITDANMHINRQNGFGSTTTIQQTFTYFSVGGTNSIQTRQSRYKRADQADTTYTAWTAITSGTVYTYILDNSYAWTYQTRAFDLITTDGNIQTWTVPKGQPLMKFDPSLVAVGIGGQPTLGYTAYVEFMLDLSSNGITGNTAKYFSNTFFPIGTPIWGSADFYPATVYGGTWTSLGSLTVGSTSLTLYKRTGLAT